MNLPDPFPFAVALAEAGPRQLDFTPGHNSRLLFEPFVGEAEVALLQIGDQAYPPNGVGQMVVDGVSYIYAYAYGEANAALEADPQAPVTLWVAPPSAAFTNLLNAPQTVTALRFGAWPSELGGVN